MSVELFDTKKLFGIKELLNLRNGEICAANNAWVNTADGLRRVTRLYVVRPALISLVPLVRFAVDIGGSHPNPSPHIRLSIKTPQFYYRQSYGDSNTVTIGDTTIINVVGGVHSEYTNVKNLPLPATIGLVQNTIIDHSTGNYLRTYIDDKLVDTQFWADDMFINVDMSETDYSPTPVLEISRNVGDLDFKRLIPLSE